MSNSDPIDQAERIKEALFQGRKIEAIKLYRQQTGMGLKESKDAVERLEAELRASSPERFQATPKKGCGVSALMVLLGGVALWRIYA